MLEHGLGDLTLRGLGAAIGTSHRMLSHHFGSKEGLWLEIVREVERRQREAFTEFMASSDEFAGPEGVMWSWWQHISSPDLWPNARLFFELYGQGLVGRHPAAALLEGDIESWTEPAERVAIQLGVPADEARRVARLGLAVTRGLLLDLLATGDRARVDEAMALWISLSANVVGSTAPDS